MYCLAGSDIRDIVSGWSGVIVVVEGRSFGASRGVSA
jgi:hypothetical protein